MNTNIADLKDDLKTTQRKESGIREVFGQTVSNTWRLHSTDDKLFNTSWKVHAYQDYLQTDEQDRDCQQG
eukprot:4497829-Amphidinium_carterae.1